MTTDPTTEEAEVPEKPPEGCLSRITPVTTPGCASCLTTLFLITTVAAVWVAFMLDADNIPWRHSMSWPRIAGVLILTAVIPYVVYKLIQLWMVGEQSPFPDLDYAWAVGQHALATNGLAIDSIPIYLVIGSNSEQQERAIMNASGRRMRVEGVPAGPSPVHWYANPDGIYLFCSDTSWTSALASLREELAAEAAAKGLSVSDTPGSRRPTSPAAAPTNPAPSNPPPAMSPPPDQGNIQGTMMLDQFVQPGMPDPQMPVASESSGNDENIRGTMMLGDPAPQPSRPRRAAAADSDGTEETEPVIVSSQYSSGCLQELQYLCHLIDKVRQPVCGVNGVLTLIQLESIHSGPAETEELQKAINADLKTIQYALQLNCPYTGLIVGLEKERGFRELVRRVGRDRAASQRFGQRFDVRAIPTEEELASLSLHVCGAFEDWAYTLFREEEALTRPGNTRLYELLSKVRCSWKTKLGDILAGGFGCRSEQAADESIYFSGCYLAATGETPDRQAFVKGVLDKLDEEQEFVEWTGNATRNDRRQEWLAVAGTVTCVVLIVSLVTMWVLNRVL